MKTKQTCNIHSYKLIMLVVAMMLLLSSCGSWRNVIYFQDLEKAQLDSIHTETNVRIRPGDQLTIMVFGADKYLIMPYNQTLNSVSEGNLGSGGGRDAQLPYDVDKEGYIKFPVIGSIKVAGLTTDELKQELYAILEKDIKDVTIFVSVENYRVNVLGEVKNPGCYNIKNNTCTFLEALALAGDCQMTADKKHVCLVRTVGGEVKHYYYDLTKSDILNSPNLYLQQNDVIIVPPTRNGARAKSTDSSTRTAIIAICSVFTAVASVLVSILK